MITRAPYRMSRNQTGSSHIVVIIGLIVVGLVAFTGYRLLYTSHADTLSNAMVGIANKCIDNKYGVTANGNSIDLYDCNGSVAQNWTYSSNKLQYSANLAYCIDVPNASKAAQTTVQLWTCNGTPAQTWVRQGDSTYRNPNSDLCLDDKYGIIANGNPIWLYACTGSSAQQWQFKYIAPVGSGSPSGEAMPTGNVDGYTYAWGEDFKTNAALGSFRTSYANSWCGYDEDAQYSTNKVIYAHDGLMDFKLSGANGAAGSFGPQSLCHGNVYGRYSMRIKAVGAAGNGTAIFVWPGSNIWHDGEMDYPEGDFDKTMSVHHHTMACTTDCSVSDSLDTGVNWQSWHTVATEWAPGYVKYYLDGKVIKTVTTNIPTTKHRYTIQMAPTKPNAQSGDFLIDWVAIWTK